MYCVLCTVYCVLCTVYCVLCTVYCVLCTVYCVLCTGCPKDLKMTLVYEYGFIFCENLSHQNFVHFSVYPPPQPGIFSEMQYNPDISAPLHILPVGTFFWTRYPFFREISEKLARALFETGSEYHAPALRLRVVVGAKGFSSPDLL